MTSSADFVVRPPWPDEVPRLKQFLHRPRGLGFDEVRALALCDAHSERLLGAAALGLPGVETASASRGAVLEIKVRPRALAADGARLLLEAAIDLARAEGCQSVSSTLSTGAPAADVLSLRGFREVKTEEVWSLNLRELGRRLEALSAKVSPNAGWSIRAPVEADMPRIRELVTPHGFRNPATLALGKPTTAGKHTVYDPDLSSVVEIAGSVQAVLLGQGTDSTAGHVDIRLVAPESMHLSGPLNLALLTRSVARALAHGYETTSLTVNAARDRETRNLALRSKSTLVDRFTVWTLQLG